MIDRPSGESQLIYVSERLDSPLRTKMNEIQNRMMGESTTPRSGQRSGAVVERSLLNPMGVRSRWTKLSLALIVERDPSEWPNDPGSRRVIQGS